MGCGITTNSPSTPAIPNSVTAGSTTEVSRTATPAATLVDPTRLPRNRDMLGPDVLAVVNGQTISILDFEQQVAQARSMYIDQAGVDPNLRLPDSS